MKSLTHFLVRLSSVIVGTAFFSSLGFAQVPANDSCAGATIILSLPYHTTENTRLATPDPSDPAMQCNQYGTGLDGKTVWFQWTADTSTWIRFSTIGSTATPPDTFDTVIGLFTGTCGSLTEVACNDDSVSGVIRQSVMYFLVQKGTTYTLLVAEWNGGGGHGGVPTGGNLVLDVGPGTPPPQPPLVRGPKTGSVASGVIANTGAFLLEKSIGRPAARIAPNMPPIPLLPTPKEMIYRKAPEKTVTIEDRSVASVQSAVSRPVLLQHFKSVQDEGIYIPPDPINAVGPNHVIVAVNSQFCIYDKNGNLLSTISLESWFQPTLPSGQTVGFSDPEVIYDQFDHRWVITGGRFNTLPYGILLSVSDDDNPIGTWYNWMLPATLGDSVTNNFPDQPQLGFDSQALYVTTREYGPTGSGIFYSRVRIIPKAQLYANTAGPVTWTDFWDLREPDNLQSELDHIKPAYTYGNPGVEFLASSAPYSPGQFFTIWQITNPTTSPAITGKNVASSAYLPAPPPGQLGGGMAIEGGGNYVMSEPVYRDSSLWVVHSVASGTGDAYSSVHYVRIDPFTNTNLEDVTMGLDGFWHFYPSIAVDAQKNVLITYSRSGVNDYIGAFAAGHRDTDPVGLSPSVLIKAGEANYSKDYNSGRNRWGDYNGIALDPADTLAVWSFTEYASSPSSTWGTALGMMKMAPIAGRFISVFPSSMNYSIAELNHQADTSSVTVMSSGFDTLVISSITISNPSFVLVNPPSLPLRLPTFASETLKVSFLPQQVGSISGYLRIASNDSINPVDSVNLSGSAFFITQAQSGVMYAASASGGGGRISTVNALTGAATAIGSSGYPAILSVRVRQSTHELLALATGEDGNQYLVRVNSAAGDAHPVAVIPFQYGAKGMAFRGDTLYAGDVAGNIYRVDMNTGNPTQVATTNLHFAGLDFNPLTGALWASVRSGSPIDGIYKVNLSTGTSTLVGRTGLNKATQDIIFDAAGNLYGLAGGASDITSFIYIDTLTASATVVGSTGTYSIVALALDPSARFYTSTFRFYPNWNLISVPPITQSRNRTSLFPFSTSSAFAYEGRYTVRDSFKVGSGYWLKVTSGKVLTVPVSADTLDTITVRQRWNMLGSISAPLPVSKIHPIPPVSLISNFFRYDKDSGYVVAATLQPGVGYWVRVDTGGQLIFSPSIITIPKQSQVDMSVEALKNMNTLTIRDGSGSAQVLYFGAEGENAPALERFELPPPGPVGMLDARFGSNTMIAFHNDKSGNASDHPILIQASSFPVTLQWHIEHDLQLRYSLTFANPKSSQFISQVLKGDGTLRLANEDLSNLQLRVEGNVLPTQFALGQNYPNPFNPTTKIHYELPKDAMVKLVVYDVLGREVATVVDGRQGAGVYDATFSASNFASGVYFYRLHAEVVDRTGAQQSFQSVKKMLMIK